MLAASRLLQAHGEGKAPAKLAKALAALDKAKVRQRRRWLAHAHVGLAWPGLPGCWRGLCCLGSSHPRLPVSLQGLSAVEAEQEVEQEAHAAKEAAKKQQSSAKAHVRWAAPPPGSPGTAAHMLCLGC